MMGTEEKWISPAEAAKEMSRLAGYVVTPDDLKQMRRRGKIKNITLINSRISLYDRDEIREAKPPKKHRPQKVPSP